MTIYLQSSGSDCRKIIQYLVAIIAVLVVGYLISILPVMAELKIAHSLSVRELINFFTKLTALILFFLLVQRSIAAIPVHNRAFAFMRAVLEPIAVLIIVVVGQDMLWQLLDPFVDGTGKTIYFSIAVGIIIIAGIWLVYTAYQEAPGLIDALELVPELVKRIVPDRFTMCSQCNHKVSRLARFCSYCGHKMVEKQKCPQCGKGIQAGQKFCEHCGHSVLSGINDTDTDISNELDESIDGQ